MNLEKIIKEITEQVIKELNQKIPIQQEPALIKNKAFKKQKKTLISGNDILKAKEENTKIILNSDNCIITPLARDLAKQYNVQIILKDQQIINDQAKVQKIKTIAIGSDQHGNQLKEQLKKHLSRTGYVCRDYSQTGDNDDYIDTAVSVARAVADKQCDLGLIVDRSGLGSCMAANKINGIRAAACHTRSLAISARVYNDANILTIGSDMVTELEAKEISRFFLTAEFQGNTHSEKIQKINGLK